ncbi:MAG TPA: L,D-transpeptidase family protein [Solirubrobacteraceae bacterium]|nr:L,D-transpeptidase family protein [Solirubrobacteraceae bacterium]
MSLLRIAIGFCLAALVALLAVKAVAQAPPVAQPPPVERIAAAVTVAGQDVSGLTVEEAAARLQQVYGEHVERGSVTVRAAGLTWRLTAARARVRFDARRSAGRALDTGRSANGAPVDVALAVDYSKRRVERFAGRIDRRLRRKPRDAQLRVSLTRVRVTHSRRGRDIDGRRLARDIGRALKDPRLGRVLEPKLLRPKPKVTAGELRRRATTAITIHQATFTLRLLKNSTVVRSYKVAVGQSDHPTPRGLFAIQSKQVNPVWSVPNSPWAGELAGTTVSGGSAANPLKARWMGIVGGVGIHGTSLGHSIGTRASHGCIRMHVPDVIELFGRVPIGTPVLIT